MKRRSLGLVLGVCGSLAACSDPQTPASASGGPATSETATTPQPTATVTATATATVTATATATGTPSDAGDKITGPYVLTFQQTGGIAGFRMETVLDSASKRITYGGPRNQKPETRDVTADDIAAITRAIEDAKMSTFPGRIKGPAMADAFTYALTIETGGRRAHVEWTDGATVAAPITVLRDALVKLRDATFRATPKNAPTQ